MNIFALDKSPSISAQWLCDKHIPKMAVESAQMMACALVRHECPEIYMPKTKAGSHYKGGYKGHPCSVWAGDSRENFLWLGNHALELVREFMKRYEKMHACTEPIVVMCNLAEYIPKGKLTPFAQAMPDKYKDKCPHKAYKAYYNNEKNSFADGSKAVWNRGTAQPTWYNGNNR